jgi:hypothetical protein
MGDMMSTRREQGSEQGEAATKATSEEEETSQHPGGPGKFDTALDYEFKRLKELNPDDFE